MDRETTINRYRDYYHALAYVWTDRNTLVSAAGPLWTPRDGNIDVARCRKMLGNLVRKKPEIKGKVVRIVIDMTGWDYAAIPEDSWDYLDSGDIDVQPIGPRQEARYDVSNDCVTIYQDGLPVWLEDRNGVCDDAAALADSM